MTVSHDPLAGFDEAALDRELVARKGFREFVRQAWSQIETVPFKDNWHIGAMCEILEACHTREIRRVIFNVPPGFMKSRTVSIFYPAWEWTLEPSAKHIFATYEQQLSYDLARWHHSLVASEWYQARWPKVKLVGAQKMGYFQNAGGGWRFSTSVGGGVTGRHADSQWIDDPTKPKDTMGGADATRTMLKKAEDFWSGTMSMRRGDPARMVRGIIMQRLHDADLAGVELMKGGYVHCMIPMRYEPKRAFAVYTQQPPLEVLRKKGRDPAWVPRLVAKDPRTEDGELAWPSHVPEESVQEAERDLAEHAPAQLQQTPVATGGGTFKAEWMQNYWLPETLPPLADMIIVQSWDMRFIDSKTKGDFVVGQVWGLLLPRFFLLDQVRGRWSFTETCDELKALSLKWPRAATKIVEDKANGPAVVNTLLEEIPGLALVPPEGGKEARANAITGYWRAKNIILPHPTIAPWVTMGLKGAQDSFESEHVRFPKATHDDQVDAGTQGVLYLSLQIPQLANAMAALKEKQEGQPTSAMMAALAGLAGRR